MKHSKLTYLAQVIAALLLLFAASMKFISDPDSIELFSRLGMEPFGRYIVATMELSAALLLLSPYAAIGSLLAFGMMCGAILAHTFELGLVVNDDGGMLVGMLVVVLLSSGFTLYSCRKDLPLVGKTL